MYLVNIKGNVRNAWKIHKQILNHF